MSNAKKERFIIPLEQKVRVDDIEINYVTVGNGNHVLLLLNGTLGPWIRLKSQIEYFDKTKFTVVVWDPPGQGKSRPPDREFPEDVIEKDAQYAYGFMKALGHSKFSVIGICLAGSVAASLAAKHPECIRRVVLLSTNVFVTQNELQEREKFAAGKGLYEVTWMLYKRMYGEEYLINFMNKWLKYFKTVYETGGSFCKEFLSSIKCPTLILQELTDTWCEVDNAIYLRDHIRNSRLVIVEKCSHYLLQYHGEVVNPVMMEFLLEESDMEQPSCTAEQ